MRRDGWTHTPRVCVPSPLSIQVSPLNHSSTAAAGPQEPGTLKKETKAGVEVCALGPRRALVHISHTISFFYWYGRYNWNF